MTMQKVLLCGVLLLSPVSLLAVGVGAETPSFAAPGTVAQFQLSEKTQIPGQTLSAGHYSITVVDHLSDRMVVRVANSDGKEAATFLALPGGSRISSKPARGPIQMSLSKGKNALRGFVFSDGSVAEFVYPKAEAVDLAKASSKTVPAIDPASEGRSASPSLSKTDRELVTLWMLTPTVVGTQQGIEAKRYEPEVAAATVPPPPAPPAGSGRVRSVPTQDVPAVAVAAPKPKKVAHPIATLPHTASELPVMMLAGFGCLMAAALMSVRRLRLNSGQ